MAVATLNAFKVRLGCVGPIGFVVVVVVVVV
jgi:hypothetical protein